MTLEYVKLGVDALKQAFWPAAVVWIAWYYRDALHKAVGRIIELSLTGVKLAPPDAGVQIAVREATELTIANVGTPKAVNASDSNQAEAAVSLQEGLSGLKQLI